VRQRGERSVGDTDVGASVRGDFLVVLIEIQNLLLQLMLITGCEGDGE
jgi:hypothetical protein